MQNDSTGSELGREAGGGKKGDRSIKGEMEGCGRHTWLTLFFLMLAGWGSRGSRLQKEWPLEHIVGRLASARNVDSGEGTHVIKGIGHQAACPGRDQRGRAKQSTA